MSKRLVSVVSISMLLFLIVNIGAFNLEGFNAMAFNVNAFKTKKPGNPVSHLSRSPGWPGEVAQELIRLGVERGAKVGVIGYAFASFWARLARVKIAAEMLESDADTFWRGDASLHSEVIEAFQSTGAKAIVAEHVPSYAHLEAWYRVGTSNYYIKILPE
jgi:hypothetical protein